MNSSAKEQPFQTLYTAVWKKPLDSILHDVPGGSVLKYIPFTILDELRLTSMNYRDEVLLIREEYDTAFDTFQYWSREGGGGVVVTGQPGIGAYYFF